MESGVDRDGDHPAPSSRQRPKVVSAKGGQLHHNAYERTLGLRHSASVTSLLLRGGTSSWASGFPFGRTPGFPTERHTKGYQEVCADRSSKGLPSLLGGSVQCGGSSTVGIDPRALCRASAIERLAACGLSFKNGLVRGSKIILRLRSANPRTRLL